MRDRDARDTSRAAAPLAKAEGAHEIVSDGMSTEEVAAKIATLVGDALAKDVGKGE